MLPTIEAFRAWILLSGAEELAAGRDCQDLLTEVAEAPPSYDLLWGLAQRVADSPPRPDWPWLEPENLAEIQAECPNWPSPAVGAPPAESSSRIEAAFLARVCGCILGKPVEINPTFQRLRAAARSVNEWPLDDYISEDLLDALGERNDSAAATTRSAITYAAPDDDLNYTITGMLLLESAGRGFTTEQLAQLWFTHLPCGWQYGPERTMNALYALGTHVGPFDWRRSVMVANAGSELCGALIRADAYAYACPGDPGQAAELTYRDASYTHRRTGVYAAMFVAAALAQALGAGRGCTWEEIAGAGLSVVPARSRLWHSIARNTELVAAATDWQDGALAISAEFASYTHCQIHQELGTLLNTLRFARDTGAGICMQVAQGNDTDSFGATAGSLLGAWYGPGSLDARWLAPFGDQIRTGLAGFPERSLGQLAVRMAALPAIP